MLAKRQVPSAKAARRSSGITHLLKTATPAAVEDESAPTM
jgi:hypothetical protein